MVSHLSVCDHMRYWYYLLGLNDASDGIHLKSLPSVCAHISFKWLIVFECCLTHITFKRSLVCVSFHVPFQIPTKIKWCIIQFAFKWLFTSVDGQVHLQTSFNSEWGITTSHLKGLSPVWMWIWSSRLLLRLNDALHTLHLMVVLQCGRTCAFSDNFLRMMHHTLHI